MAVSASFKQKFLAKHNEYRKNHGVPEVTLNEELSETAQAWANHLLSKRSLAHSDTDDGENVFYSYSSVKKEPTGPEAVESWYSEIKDYNFSKPGHQPKTGHFTQVVWKETKEIGVGMATDGNTVFVVGQYRPAGNITNAGYYEKNVLPADKSCVQQQHCDKDNESKNKCEDPKESGTEHSQIIKTVKHTRTTTGESVVYSYTSVNSEVSGPEDMDKHFNEMKDAFNKLGHQPKAGPKAVDKCDSGNKDDSKPEEKPQIDEKFKQEFLAKHNEYRTKHGVPKVTLSEELSKTAQTWADHLLSKRSLGHSDTDDGENVYYSFSSVKKKPTGAAAVESWYSEIKDYDFSKSGHQPKTGHFTQVVWKETKEIGVGMATDGNTVFVVGQYRPAGNITNAGYYEKNVLPAGHTTTTTACIPQETEQGKKRLISWKAMADASFKQKFLAKHNEYRKKHRVPELTLSKDLCKTAQAWANHLLSIKSLGHSNTEDGENVFYSFSSVKKEPTGPEAVESWYSEIKDYNFSKPGHQPKTGHFTQVVWKETKEIGVGMATDGNTVFVVGQYRPAGNITNAGYYEKNVLPADKSCVQQQHCDKDNESKNKCEDPKESGTEHSQVIKTVKHTRTTTGESVVYSYTSVNSEVSGPEDMDKYFNEMKDAFNKLGHQPKAGPKAVDKCDNGNKDDDHSKPEEKPQIDEKFKQEFLAKHNEYRTKHGVPKVTLSEELSKTAQTWADHLLSKRSLGHSDTDDGENVYYSFSSVKKKPTGAAAVESWYSEIKDYNFSKSGHQPKTGHFTQVVWKETKEIGVGMATDGNTVFVVGQYRPAGNITNAGYYEKNVLPAGK
ncbi:GLI pathogenesis-related 2 [Hoplias malabaricus]|uniref:GLI pathogenesis-related 2 n=1 Tax=Hoplias malabaricus TaxID=27720 RepID=UPI003461A266